LAAGTAEWKIGIGWSEAASAVIAGRAEGNRDEGDQQALKEIAADILG
jgi:hypothetical protein